MSDMQYPLDANKILRKKKTIKKQLLKDQTFLHKKVAILGGSTTAEIKNILDLFLLQNGIKAQFYESEYNQYFEDAVFGTEELEIFNPDIVYIHTTNVNITRRPNIDMNEEEISMLLDEEENKFKSIWNSLNRFSCAIIQNNFDLPIIRGLGNLDCYDKRGETLFINQLNDRFARNARELKNLYINDINYLSAFLGLQNWFDRSLWFQAKYALSMEAIPELAFNLSKIINAILGKTKKCLIVDLDNTCWGGVIGDDGLNGILIGNETPIAELYTTFQSYLLKLKKRGIALAVCSKNDLTTAQEGFSHPDSILSLKDFAVFKANWHHKHENIKQIAKEINIGTDSLVFIDDNPAEREIVSSQIPEIAVPNVGDDATCFLEHIDRNGFFEPIPISEDDLNRNRYFQVNKKRKNAQEKFGSYDDFLAFLNMKAKIKPFSPIYLNRIAQLTNKTNQFNLTTKRYTYGEIANVSGSPEFIKLYGKLSDKYGDNGLIAVSIGRIETHCCHIDLWLMSCRVLKREMELAMLDMFVQYCRNNSITEIIGYYYKSAKNSIVADFYKNHGFELVSQDSDDSIWKLNIDHYKNKNWHIRIEDD